jgi:hypothetical protein
MDVFTPFANYLCFLPLTINTSLNAPKEIAFINYRRATWALQDGTLFNRKDYLERFNLATRGIIALGKVMDEVTCFFLEF